ncbi:hypothetical protein KP509_25G037500 [Ceratopteris richardii]|uniref:EF-hand domain-containing protein n=1 Tax=Ceratopteris richardii TaxID=49495 RepID=A0A8T2RRZ1_CERRI|nr:hypothetical protein KP509_25G037500 [Ceratopteris richardii]
MDVRRAQTSSSSVQLFRSRSSPSIGSAASHMDRRRLSNSFELLYSSGLNAYSYFTDCNPSLPSCARFCSSETNTCTGTISSSSWPCRMEGHDRCRTQFLDRVFNVFDVNGDGCVSFDEISQTLKKLGIGTSEMSNPTVLSEVPNQSQSYLSEKEFHDLCATLYSPLEVTDITKGSAPSSSDGDQDLIAAFHVFDKDDDGFITPKELQEVLRSLGFGEAMQLDACVAMIGKVDQDGDGRIDFQEFKLMFDFPEVCPK